jgi:hypothetical protein
MWCDLFMYHEKGIYISYEKKNLIVMVNNWYEGNQFDEMWCDLFMYHEKGIYITYEKKNLIVMVNNSSSIKNKKKTKTKSKTNHLRSPHTIEHGYSIFTCIFLRQSNIAPFPLSTDFCLNQPPDLFIPCW